MNWQPADDDEDTGAPAGCALLAGIIVAAAIVLYAFTFLEGTW